MSAVYAWTAPGGDYPEFVNVSDAEDAQGEPTIKLTVRGPKAADGPGATVCVTLPVMEYARLVGFLRHHFDSGLKFK